MGSSVIKNGEEKLGQAPSNIFVYTHVVNEVSVVYGYIDKYKLNHVMIQGPMFVYKTGKKIIYLV